MAFKIDDSKPKDSIDYHWSETCYDGEEGSFFPIIGSHWHKVHDEIMTIVKGKVEFTLDGKVIMLTPENSPLKIPRLHTHSFKFQKGVPTTLIERTDPPGTWKEDTFENILDDGKVSFVGVLRGFYDGDAYIALPFGIGVVDEAFMSVAGGLAKFFYPQKNKGQLARQAAERSAKL